MKILAVGGALVVALLFAAAAFTFVMARVIEARHPPVGRLIAVSGGRLHVVEAGPKDREPVATLVMIHGASGSQGDMMVTLGARLSDRYRVIAVDRPGHGWSDRPGGRPDAAPGRQAALIRQALEKIGIGKAIVVSHSMAGAVGTSLALDAPELVTGLVLLAPVSHPWPGGVSWYYSLVTAPVIGPLFSHTLALPIGLAVIDSAVGAVFAPQHPPDTYIAAAGAKLVLRPGEFRANAEDVKDLLGYVRPLSLRYGAIKAPTVIITGEADTIVSPKIHSASLVREIKDARLVMLPGVGHVPQWAAPDLVVREIDRLAKRLRAEAG